MLLFALFNLLIFPLAVEAAPSRLKIGVLTPAYIGQNYDLRGHQSLALAVQALDEINSDPNLLPATEVVLEVSHYTSTPEFLV